MKKIHTQSLIILGVLLILVGVYVVLQGRISVSKSTSSANYYSPDLVVPSVLMIDVSTNQTVATMQIGHTYVLKAKVANIGRSIAGNTYTRFCTADPNPTYVKLYGLCPPNTGKLFLPTAPLGYPTTDPITGLVVTASTTLTSIKMTPSYARPFLFSACANSGNPTTQPIVESNVSNNCTTLTISSQ